MAKKKSRQIRLLNRFIRIFFISFAIFIVMAAIGTIGYVQVASSNNLKKLKDNNVTTRAGGEDIDDVLDADSASALLSREITTVAVFGVDKDGYRTDVNMLVFFHHKTGEIDIVSIPRDTKVKIPDDIFQEINEVRSGVKQNERINAIPAYVSASRRNEVSVSVLENVFGVDVDYFVNMDLDGFKYIVDEIGPIEINIPMDMRYDDPAQNPPLHIDLKAGLQEINGAQAEMLIRYRKGYATADIGRIEMQHEFMKAFMEELLKPENRFNMVGILDTVFFNVTTDFKDAVDYLIYLDDISVDKISMQTLPGGGSPHDGSYEYDVAATKVMFETIINKNYDDDQGIDVAEGPEENSSNSGSDDSATEDSGGDSEDKVIIEVEPIEPVDPADYTISVQNAARVSKLASRTSDRLTEAGFNVVEIGNYEVGPIEKTIIKAPDREIGELLANYFDNPDVYVDLDLKDAEIQVIIAVGTDDAEE